MSSGFVAIAPALALGIMLGSFFFGGLWWTIKVGVGSAHPARWFFGSLIVRTGVVLAGFYLAVIHGHWRGLVGCFVGFLLARVVTERGVLRTELPSQSQVKGGASLAP